MWFEIENDQPPPPETMVLTLWDGTNNKTTEPVREYYVASYDGADWTDNDGNVIDEPTHWTWLPEPPEQ